MELTDMQIHAIGNHEGFTKEQLEMLDSPLDASLIKQRPDGKKYLKGSTEFDAANHIFGYGKWGYRVIGRTLQKVYDLEDKVVGLYFYVEVELYVAGAMFPFYGDGGQGVKYYTAQGYEDAAKGATTDAVKRALRHYGNAFGLPLYDEDALVDAGDGVMVKVKEVKVNNNQQPPKRIVDGKPAPRQIAQGNVTQTPEDALKSRLNALYDLMVETGQLTKGSKAEVFLAKCGQILKITIVAPEHLTNSRLDSIEKYLRSLLSEEKAS